MQIPEKVPSMSQADFPTVSAAHKSAAIAIIGIGELDGVTTEHES
jgi:hypothetical protein